MIFLEKGLVQPTGGTDRARRRHGVAARSGAWLLWGMTVVLAGAHALVFFRGSAHFLDADGYLQNFPLITAAGLVGVTVGALIVNRHPRHVVGWLFVVGYTVTMVGIVAADYGGQAPPETATTAHHLANWVGLIAGAPLAISFFCFIALLFPDGHLPSPRWRAVAWVTGINIAVGTATTVVALGSPTRTPRESDIAVGLGFHVPLVAMFVILILMIIFATASLVTRVRSAEGDRRRQLLWILVAVAYLAVGVIGIGVREPLDAVGVPVWTTQLVLYLGPSAIPLAAGLAIFRYRLYDIEVIVNRTLVLVCLIGFATLAYAGIVAGVGSLVGRRAEASLWLTLLATAAVALAFQPLYRQARRLADRVAYGRRAAPYEVMAQLAQTMADAVSVEEILPRAAAAAARITGAQAARARVFLPGGTAQAAAWPGGSAGPAAHTTYRSHTAQPDRDAGGGTGGIAAAGHATHHAPGNTPGNTPGETPGQQAPERPENAATVQVRHGGEVIADIAVETAPGTPLPKGRTALLGDLARACGPPLHTVRLTAELRRRVEQIGAQGDELRESRRRIVASRDEERQLLEEEIDTHVMGRLQAIDASLDDSERCLLSEPAQASAALAAAQATATTALEQLRDLAGGVFPPLLADRGVAAAVEARLRRTGVPGRVRTDAGTGAPPPPPAAGHPPAEHPPVPGQGRSGGAPPPARFPPTTEAAIYFCCAEVIESRSRDPHPDPLAIRIRAEGDTVIAEIAVAAEVAAAAEVAVAAEIAAAIGTGAGGAGAGAGAGADGGDPAVLDERRVMRMRDRVEALGGQVRLDGATLVLHLPATAPDPADDGS